MTDTKHTPGPWVWDEYYTGLDGANGQSVLIYIDYEGMSIHGKTVAQSEANARLIAAAPELLEACIGLLQVQDGIPMTGLEATRKAVNARAAIAKAKGKTE